MRPSRQRPPRALGLALAMGAALASTAAGCDSGDQTIVFVTVASRPAVLEVVRLDVVLTNANATLAQGFDVEGRDFPLTFTVTADGRDGDLGIDVVAVGEADAERARGHAAAALVSGDQVDITFTLEPVDIVVNSSIAGAQRLNFRAGRNGHQIAVDAAGAFQIAWSNDCTTLNRCDEFARRFGADARPARNGISMDSNEFIVNQSDVFGLDPAIASTGTATAVCFSTLEELRCNFLDATGAHAGAGDVVIAAGSEIGDPALDALADGNFLAVWTEPSSDGAGDTVVRGQLLGPAGALLQNPTSGDTGPFTISTSPGSPDLPAVSATGDGHSAAVVWMDGTSVFWRTLDATGALQPAAQVAVASYPGGLFISGPQLAWHEQRAYLGWGVAVPETPPYEDGAFLMRRLTLPLGNPDGAEVVVATAPLGRAGGSSLAVRGDGAVLYAWHDCEDHGDGDGCGILAQLLRPTGLPVGAPERINTTLDADQVDPTVAAGPDAFIVAWNDESEVAPDTSAAAVRARLLYPSLDIADGRLGAHCGGPDDAACGADLACVAGSDDIPHCHAVCDPAGPAPQCPGGGLCSSSADLSACLF